MSGHPDVTWCIAVEATLADSVDREASVERVRAAVRRREHALGPPPLLQDVEEADRAGAVDRTLNRPFPPGGPFIRVATVSGAEPRLILAAHHSILDGLGLMALLRIALDRPVGSTVAGLDARSVSRRGFAVTAVSRAFRAAVRPSARIAPEGGQAGASGDHLSVHRAPGESAGTALLVVAMGRSIERWNRAHEGRTRGLEVSVGVSLRPGRVAGLDEGSAYMLLRLPRWDADAVRRTLRNGVLEPVSPSGRTGRALDVVARPVARLMSDRMGSSGLVSSIGRLDVPPEVHAVALYPVAHGRSGVALGAAAAHGTTTLAFRMRRRDFGREAVEEFASTFLSELRSLSR